MYLKEIRAKGFKSFADVTKIELHEGITGVVGPNGSGKSNVVDAVRWVLGEQSVKELRGGTSMTDVIFSGSKDRNSQNVASVTLVFDNTDKYLPLDYNEVAIKRRVYKDGTNEYFLNGEKVRLKDITSILLDSGIAKESFNIISQGKIDEILSSKPSERRVIFEEAAGVLKYKRRKEEALRKLTKTNDNINRVNDIILELEAQVLPLKDQKEKAIKYSEISKELKVIEVALATNDITNMNNIYQNNLVKIEALNDEITKSGVKESQSDAEIINLKESLRKLQEQITHFNKELILKTALAEKLNGEKKLVTERKNYDATDAKHHENLIRYKETRLELQNRITKNNTELTKINENFENINLKLITVNNKISNLKNTKKELLDNLTKLNQKELNINSKISYLEDSIENGGMLPKAVKAVIQNPRFENIKYTIGDVIETETQYSEAISTVLGAAANFVITETTDDAKNAIEYLKSNNIGRATFFPLSVIKSKSINQEVIKAISNEKGYLGIASSLVKFDKKYTEIIENQLGNIIVVDNINDATKLSKKIRHSYRIVTLDGDLLHVGGSLSGGAKQKFKNIISEKNELEELIQENKNNCRNILELENRINDTDYMLKNYEDEMYLISKDKMSIAHEIDLNKADNIKLNDNIAEIESKIISAEGLVNGTLTAEEDSIINDYYEALKEKEETEFNLKIAMDKKTELSELLEEKELETKRETHLLSDKNNELKLLEIEVNRIDVKIDNLLNMLSENYNLTYEKAKSEYRLDMEEEVARRRLSVLKTEVKNIGPVNLNAPDEYDKVSERYEFLIAQRDDLAKAETMLLEIIKEMDIIMEKEFIKSFKQIEENFEITFKELFKGGSAKLKLTDPENILETGIDIIASPPGKKLTHISLLSGGEKTFTAISLLFAILKSRKVPFCILDEVEAALDEVNVESFGNYISNLKANTQFILITHKKKTMEYVDSLYGITMQESGVSKLVSVSLKEI